MLELIREHHLRMPAHVSLLFKAAAMSEGLVLTIAPDKALGDFLAAFAAIRRHSRMQASCEWRRQVETPSGTHRLQP